MFCKSDQIENRFHRYDINIRYPSYWFAPVRLSPFACTIEKETIHWMDKLGLIRNAERLQHVRAMEPRHYAGYTHSMASYDHALLYCKYITMWLLWDDECVEVAQKYEDVEMPLLALAGEQLPKQAFKNPYVIAFKDLGDGYESLGASRAWRIRFTNKMIEWAERAVDEEKVRAADVHRHFMDAVRLRSFTVGIRPNSLPLERAVGIEIPSDIYLDNNYEALLDQAAIICCIVNDLVGVAKDIKNNQIKSNLVLYHQLYHQCSLRESFAALTNIHNEAVVQYDKLANILLAKTKADFKERLLTFFTHLRYMDSGFGFWHRDCIRYQEYSAIEDYLYFKLSIHTN